MVQYRKEYVDLVKGLYHINRDYWIKPIRYFRAGKEIKYFYDRRIGKNISYEAGLRARAMISYWNKIRAIMRAHPGWSYEEARRRYRMVQEMYKILDYERWREWSEVIFSP